MPRGRRKQPQQARLGGYQGIVIAAFRRARMDAGKDSPMGAHARHWLRSREANDWLDLLLDAMGLDDLEPDKLLAAIGAEIAEEREG